MIGGLFNHFLSVFQRLRLRIQTASHGGCKSWKVLLVAQICCKYMFQRRYKTIITTYLEKSVWEL